uniref:Uncharacterized protein n=1 Tax=Parascaris equorum TaxID=6256 RepID=A0A914S3D5_PAREQ
MSAQVNKQIYEVGAAEHSKPMHLRAEYDEPSSTVCSALYRVSGPCGGHRQRGRALELFRDDQRRMHMQLMKFT